MSSRDYRLRKRGSKGQYVLGRHDSGYVQPTGTKGKRQANKIVRRSKELFDGGYYKKLSTWFEWN
jgi:hypothetical protein